MQQRIQRLMAVTVLVACGVDDGGRDSIGSASAFDPFGDETGTDGGDDGAPKFDAPVDEPETGGGCNGGGEFEFSYIWIANSGQGTVSKIDTITGVELGRYYASPAQQNGDPSRTSVNQHGNVAVAIRGPGGITKIGVTQDHCKDVNNDGVITTSTGPNDIKPWGQDECVLWHTQIPSESNGSGPRPIAWEGVESTDPDSCSLPTPRVWIGYRRGDSKGEYWRIDGTTGVPESTVAGPGYDSKPYGGAVDANNDFWATGFGHDPAIRIDSETLEVFNYGNPGVELYGMALDQDGDLWAADWSDTGRFAHLDASTGEWEVIQGGGGRTRGIMVDRDGYAWAAGNGGCGLEKIDTHTSMVVGGSIPLPGCEQPVGISIDGQGFVWVVDKKSEKAHKVDPESHQVVLTVGGLVDPYTYSDMTGVGLSLVFNPEG